MSAPRITPPPISGARRGREENSKRTGKIHFPDSSKFEPKTQHVVRWLVSNYHLSLPMAEVVADLAGLGVER